MEQAEIDYYDRRWSEEDRQSAPPAQTRVRLTKEAVENLQHGNDIHSVVDVGCGNGWILAALSDLNGALDLFGVEPSTVGAENARLRVPNATIETGTLGDSSLIGPFDIAVSSEVIEHVADQRQYLEEIANVIRAEGFLVLTTPNGRFRDTYFDDVPHAEPQPVEDWLTLGELLELASPWFSVIEQRTFGPEYYIGKKSNLRRVRQLMNALPGGQRSRRLIDTLVNRRWNAGLNILTSFRRNR